MSSGDRLGKPFKMMFSFHCVGCRCSGLVGGEGGRSHKKLGKGVRLASQKPYPIYDRNLQFSLLYLWPDQIFDTLFVTWYPISYQNGKMAKINTLFMTKMPEKLPFGAAHTYKAHKREYPLPPPGSYGKCARLQIKQYTCSFEPWPWHCVVFLNKTLHSYSASLKQDSQGAEVGVIARWTSILYRVK